MEEKYALRTLTISFLNKRRCQARLVQGWTARAAMPEHHGLIPVRTKSYLFCERSIWRATIKETLGLLCLVFSPFASSISLCKRQFVRLPFLFLNSLSVLCVANERVGFSSTVSPRQHMLWSGGFTCAGSLNDPCAPLLALEWTYQCLISKSPT